MGKSDNTLTSLKDVIKSLTNGGELPFDLEDTLIWKVWDDVVGPIISKKSRPSWIKNKILRVIVSDSIWLQELQFVEEEIRKRLNERLKREKVLKIEFRIGK